MITTRPSRRRTMMELADIPESVKRSPAKKSPARKSPARKSPARKSPARKSPTKKSAAGKSPTRKSPGRKKSTKPNAKILDSPVADIVDIDDKIEEVIPRTLRPRARVAPSFSKFGIPLGDDYSSASSRRSTRSETRDVIEDEELHRKSLSKEPTPALLIGETPEEKEKTPSVKSFSREVSVARSSPASSITWPSEFGGLFGVITLIPMMPLAVLVAHIAVTHTWDENKPSDWLPWLWSQLDPVVIATYFTFAFCQLLITALPLGKRVDGLPDKYGRWLYRCNGLIAVFLTAIVFGVAWTMKKTSFLMKLSSHSGFISMIAGSILWGLIMSVLLLIKSYYSPVSSLNPAAITRSKIYNFFMGRQLCPRVGGIIDFKFAFQRIAIIGLISINAVLVLGEIIKGTEIQNFSYPFLLCVGLQLFYALDLLWFEDQFPTSFTAMYEGGGYLHSMSSSLYPFLPTLLTRYLVQQRFEYPLYCLCAIVVLNLFGYIIYRGSNAQKNEFRKNPMNPSLAHLEVIPTTRGKKLLVTGWWGWLRHPNYLGDIIIQWSWLLTCGYHSPLPFVAPVFTMFALIYRAHRDNSRCHHRYNVAWDRYCARVPYRVIPGVY